MFSRPEGNDIQVFLGKVERKAEKAREDFEKRWNFSLVEDKPFEGSIEWETLKARKSSGAGSSVSAQQSKGSKCSSSSKSTMEKHFKMRKIRKKSGVHSVPKAVDLNVERKYSNDTTVGRSTRHRGTKRKNCSSYFLRPLPQKNYSQFTSMSCLPPSSKTY